MKLSELLAEAKSTVTEMAAIGDFSSGWLKSRQAKELVDKFRAGQTTADLADGTKFKAVKSIKATSLVAGMMIMASYNSSNQGASLYLFKGVTGAEGGDDVKYGSVKEAMADAGVKTIKELELKADEGDGDSGYRLVVKDLENGHEGGFFYLYKGRYVRGSGAEALTLTQVEKV